MEFVIGWGRGEGKGIVGDTSWKSVIFLLLVWSGLVYDVQKAILSDRYGLMWNVFDQVKSPLICGIILFYTLWPFCLAKGNSAHI